MQFQINTPQSVGASLAIKESRKASKRKAAYPSDQQPSPKRQKSLHSPVPLAPAVGPAPAPAPSQIQSHATALSGPTEEVATLADASPSPAQTQMHNATDFSHTGDIARKRKPDDFPVDSVQGNQVHDVTDLEPAPKKQKLSYATLPSAKAARKRLSNEECARIVARNWRRRLESWCRQHGHDYKLLDRLPDDVLTHPDFRAHAYLLAQTSPNHSKVQGAPDLDLYPSEGSAVKKLINGTPRFETHALRFETQALRFETHDPIFGTHGVSNQNIPGSPHNTATQVHASSRGTFLHHKPAQCQISAERPDSGDENSHPQCVRIAADPSLLANGVFNGACPTISDQTSTSLSSIKSASRSPICDAPDINPVYDTSNTSSDRSVSASSVRDIANHTTAASSDQNISVSSGRDGGYDTAATSDQIAPLSPNSNLRDSSTNVTSSPTPSVGPPRNRGGRPKGRKPRPAKPFKTPKGPMRFQKNHPVKAAVNVDVWENILTFCPPDFLLKARTVSSTFRSVLKDDSPIWKISRVKHFGSDMPGPPSGLSEPQYADLLTGTGCQTRGCTSKKTRKTYWAFQRRLCMDCFHQAFVPPRALRRMYKELETSEMPQYRSIAQYYQNMEEFLPGLKFDRWDNYQWLGDYDPTPAWGQVYRSGQYVAFPASAYASFSSELADLVGNEYDVEEGRFSSSNRPMPGKTCSPQDEVDAWFDMKRVINDTLVSELQAVENWYETYKRNNQKLCKDLREDRDTFYKEQAELAGFDKAALKHYDCYKAAIAISKPATMQSWNILLPKLKAEREKANVKETEAFERDVESEMNYEWSVDEWNDHGGSV